MTSFARIAAPPLDLQSFIASYWPQLSIKLAERTELFANIVNKSIVEYEIYDPEAAARYLNLCFALGPGFERKAENEWALATLSDRRIQPWVRVHQVILRANEELRKRGDEDRNLIRADEALLFKLEEQRRSVNSESEPLARVECDLTAIELRCVGIDWRREYCRNSSAWQYQPISVTSSRFRGDASAPIPSKLVILGARPTVADTTRLQVRQVNHGGCNTRHPAVRYIGNQGVLHRQGADARSVDWPVVAPPFVPPTTGLGLALIEETTPEVSLLQVPTCGLRDEGVPMGPVATQVWAYPADPWLFALQRDASVEHAWPGTAESSVPSIATRCRAERDGQPVPTEPWLRGFDEQLPQATTHGFRKLFEAWQSAVQAGTMTLRSGWLLGSQAVTWGWREGPGGMADDAVMRVLADLDLACAAQLTLTGEIQVGGIRAALRLQAQGQSRAQHSITREDNTVPLLQAIGGATVRFRFPFSLELDPIATPEAVLCCDVGSCTGALTGEAGLRPRRSGGSGWEWFVRANVEPVMVALMLQDPVLGQSRRNVVLLPPTTVLDWSLG